jgi:hypothetical protein
MLSKFGLPNGAKNETKMYVAPISKVIEQSSQDEKTFLSIFTPYKPVNDPKDDGDMGGYFDYIEVYPAPGKEGVSLDTKGTQTFNFVSGLWVAASHNGLLAVKRLMDQMKGKGGKATVSFQTQKNSEVVSLNVEQAYDKTATVNMYYNLLIQLSIKNPEKTMYAEYSKKGNNYIIGLLNNNVVSTVMGLGAGGFMDNSKKDTILPVMSKVKGFITKENLGVDFTPLANKMISLSTMEDRVGAGQGANPEKMAKLKEFNGELNAIIEKLKLAYINNFKLYVSTYLKATAPQIIPMIDRKVVFPLKELGNEFDRFIHSYQAGSITTPAPTLQQDKRTYKSGD